MKKKSEEQIYAFIDSQNLNLGVRDQGWSLDFNKFHIYLKEKYKVSNAYIFIGYLPGNEDLYTKLQSYGYICVFKPTLELKNGKVKGNVDAELVLHTMIQFNTFNKAIIISGDGDFYCLIEYLLNNHKFNRILIPNKDRYSGLLKKLSTPGNNILAFVSDLKSKLMLIDTEYNEKGSQSDKTNREPLSS